MRRARILLAAPLLAASLVGCSSPEAPATAVAPPSVEGSQASKPVDHMSPEAKAAMDAGRAASGQ